MIPAVSAIIPFCTRDAHLVMDAINSILLQTIPSNIYVVGDKVDDVIFARLMEEYEGRNNIIYLRTDKTLGPYCIANSVVKHHLIADTQYIAIQDADDISYHSRFETQILAMKNIIDHCSGPMRHVALKGYKGDRHLKEPTLLCGVKARNVPLGRFINGTRMISLDLFKKLNGFPPIFCSGDICFDNTLQHLGIVTAVTTQVLAERRLHPDSLTNHPDSSRSAPVRQTCMEYLFDCLRAIQNKPSLETAITFGGLNTAKRIEELC